MKQIDEGMHTVRSLPRGEYVRKKQDAAKTYIRGEYDASTKRYELVDVDDINRTCWIKGDALVFAGFTY